MTPEQAKEKAIYWLSQIKEKYNYEDFEPCDFLLPEATVLDLIMLADDVEMLSEMMLVHGEESIKPCLCEALSYVIEMHKNECYKTLRAADILNMEDCIKVRKETMSGMMSGLFKE